MPKRVLIQLDGDSQPSTFDAIVAIDAGADVLLRHGGVRPEDVTTLVHGAMFTRGPAELANTAIFIGGSDVAAADALAKQVAKTFFDPLRVGVLVDPSGANTTAAAAVVLALRHLVAGREPTRAVVLGGTGPVGQRVGRLLVRKGMHVTLSSRSLARAETAALAIREKVAGAKIGGVESHGTVLPGSPLAGLLATADLVIAAGAAGAVLLDAAGREQTTQARVLIDLSAVPPAGIHGIVAGDKGRSDGQQIVYGALGVGGAKMKIHREALERIFNHPDAFLDAEELLAIGETVG
jgi:methylenetetrahydrofolate/methylenetetrahydromethanopterin dehydrogenase (NADP+)